MSNQGISPVEVVAGGLSEKEIEALETNAQLRRYLDAAAIAIPAVLRAAHAGNVTCREAAKEIIPLISDQK